MAVEIIFPRVDMDMTSGRISRWLVEEGGAVGKGDPLFEIETDKAAMEIDAAASGTLHRSSTDNGEEIAVGTAVGWIVAEGESWPAATAATVKLGAKEAATPAPSQLCDASSGCGQVPAGSGMEAMRATPLARREAVRLGVELRAVRGSGPRGRIVAADVAAGLPSAPAVAPRSSIADGAARVFRHWLGRREGTPLLFLHGFGSDQTSWRPVWAELESGQRILAIDLPGHGRSAASGTVSFAALVAAVQEVLEEEGVSRLHVIGHSLGGAVALGLADAGGAEIRSLSLIATAGLGPEIDGDFLDGVLRAEREESLAPWLRRLFADPARATQAFVRASLRGLGGPAARAYRRELVRSMFPDGTQAVVLDHVLTQLAAPVQVIWGIQDRIIPALHASRLPPMVALHRLPGGHMPQLEEPRTVSLLIERLVRSALP